jgi:hypothetical protein
MDYAPHFYHERIFQPAPDPDNRKRPLFTV